jgi:hypothetical protein
MICQFKFQSEAIQNEMFLLFLGVYTAIRSMTCLRSLDLD